MKNTGQNLHNFILRIGDISIMIACLLAGAVLSSVWTENTYLYDFFKITVSIQNIAVFAFFLCLWQLVYVFQGLYEFHLSAVSTDEAIAILKANAISCSIFYGLMIFFWQNSKLEIYYILSIWVVSTIFIVTIRALIRFAGRPIRKYGAETKNVLVVGANSRAIEYVNKIILNPNLGYNFLGFIDTNWKGTNTINKMGYDIVSDLNGFADFVSKNIVDEVIISLPVKTFYEQSMQVIEICQKHGILVRHLPNIFNLNSSTVLVENFGGDFFITQYSSRMSGLPALFKYAIDKVVSLILLAFFSPIFILIAVAIKKDSPGPIFFIQKRVGINKRRFNLYKFRTMVDNAEEMLEKVENLNEVAGAAFKIQDDPRITSVGKILRKASLDELPQLFNVLRGDMSLVGPRPLPIRDFEGFSQDWQRRRFSVRPGITCLWQVAGRHNVSFQKWMELDLEYIDHWSLLLDFAILFKTIPAVVRGNGAW